MCEKTMVTLGRSIETLANKLFREAGYSVTSASGSSTEADFYALKPEGGAQYYVNVKASMSIDCRVSPLFAETIRRFCESAVSANATPVLMVFALLTDNQRVQYSRLNEKLIVLDIANVLYAVQGTPLETEIIAVLPFVTDQIERKAGDINLSFLKHGDGASGLVMRLEACPAGKAHFSEYEAACLEALKYIFSSDLALFCEQRYSNMGLYRFDVVTRIKDGVDNAFWGMMERYFYSKYIVFEFKNYNNPITQAEIYTTERYLYKKALRRVAIIIARNGFDDHAKWAAKGSLREQGKLILLLTNTDLVSMVNLKRKGEDPSELLLNMVDKLLLDLEK